MPEITDEQLKEFQAATAKAEGLTAQVSTLTETAATATKTAEELGIKFADIEKNQKEAADKNLVEQNQFKELSEARGVEIETLKKQNDDFKGATTRFMAIEAIKTEALKQGMLEKALPEVNNWNLDTIKVTKDGSRVTVTGVKELVEAAKETQDYLFGTGKPIKVDDVPVGAGQGSSKFKKLTTPEIVELMKKDPEKYKRYVKAASKGELVE